MKPKLRLIITKDCPRNCDGCCNKDWDIDSLPRVNDFSGYKEVYVTGGEPMLYPELVMDIAKDVHRCGGKVYLYTALTTAWSDLLLLMPHLDGLTVTLHQQSDTIYFSELVYRMGKLGAGKSLRLNVFKGITTKNINTSGWVTKKHMVWIKDCPLPEGEELAFYKELL